MGIYTEENRIINDCSGLNSSGVGTTIPFVLSACGYDVWLGNYRGNRYSDGHVVFNSAKGKFYISK